MANQITATWPDLDVYDLDVLFAATGPAVGELMNDTSDNCGSTGESACVGCGGGGDDD